MIEKPWITKKVKYLKRGREKKVDCHEKLQLGRKPVPQQLGNPESQQKLDGAERSGQHRECHAGRSGSPSPTECTHPQSTRENVFQATKQAITKFQKHLYCTGHFL